MTKTEHYQLNQWEPSDPIRREDFNADNAAIDAAIKAVADTAGSKASAESVTAVEQQIAAVEQTVKFVKLGGPVVTTTANQTIAFSLANIDMSEYTALLVVAEVAASSGYVSLLVNGSSMLALCSNNNSQACATAWLLPGESKVLGFSQGVCSSSEVTSNFSGKGAVAVAWSAVTSIGVTGTSNKGMSCTLYGLKG